jgi:hypothetical protein
VAKSILDWKRWISVGAGVGVVLLAGSSASARTITLRWTHDESQAVADGFRARWGTSSGSHPSTVELGKPAPSSGVYSKDITVDDATVYVVLTAYGAGGSSPDSNEKMYDFAAPAPSPSPDPSPSPTDPQAAVLGFALVDANDGTRLIDDDITDGEAIPLAVGDDCLSILIVGNTYLEQRASPGSVMMIFDGQRPGQCDAPGFSHENEAPLNFRGTGCTPELAPGVPHTFEAIPFDGDDCTGLSGTAFERSFELIEPVGTGGGTPAPGDEPLGAPGQPYLVN